MTRTGETKATLLLVENNAAEGSRDVLVLRQRTGAEIGDEDGFGRGQGKVLEKPVALPACARVPDKALVARAMQEIRAIVAKTVTRGMHEVGDYLLREFYDDDPTLYRSASHSKHASIRLLERQCETMNLPLRRTFLVNAIRIAALSRELPKDAKFRELPPSHRIELLRLGSPEKIEQVAAKAVERSLSVHKLREMVQRDQERGKPARGRRSPAALAALRACVAHLRDPNTGRVAFRKGEIAELGDDERAEARVLVEILIKRAQEFARLLE